MAKINFGIFGALTGKLGPVIGSTWKGIPYLKKTPDPQKNKKRSVAQLANEAKFKFVNTWLIPFHPFITVGFENLAIRKTAIAVAISRCYNTVFSGAAPDMMVDHSKMQISEGPLPMITNVSAVFLSANTVELRWKKNYMKGTAFNDQIIMALYSEELKIADGFCGGVNRANERHVFTLHPEIVGVALHVYVSLSSFTRKQISNSQYLNQIQPL